MNDISICATGHRPNKLYGYNYNEPRWQILKAWFKEELIKRKCTNAITGMALGVDQIFALAVLELKIEGYDIRLVCAVPCRNQQNKWPYQSQRIYNDIIAKADEVVLVTNMPYHPFLMQKRNEWMVDHSNTILAVWDGTDGGTKNCIEYAKKKNKLIINYLESHS